MASLNRVILMGNLTRDPEVRFTNGDMAICKLGMAMNRKFKDASGEWREETTFVDVTIFGKRGETFARYHKKGQLAFVEGRLRLDSWEDKNSGQKRSKLEVIAENWEFVGGRGADAEGGSYAEPRRQTASSAPEAGGGGGGGGGADEFLEVDDTPF
jgi:single-strand DNA-binding protein